MNNLTEPLYHNMLHIPTWHTVYCLPVHWSALVDVMCHILMVNDSDLGSLGEDVNHPVNPCWDIGCRYPIVYAIDGEMNGPILLPGNSNSVANLQETT